MHVLVAVSRDQIPLEQLDKPSCLKTDLFSQLPLDTGLDGLIFPVHVSGGDFHEHSTRRMPVLADQYQFTLGIHRDDGDARPVIDPTLSATPTVGEKDVALEDIEDAAAVHEIPGRFVGFRHCRRDFLSCMGVCCTVDLKAACEARPATPLLSWFSLWRGGAVRWFPSAGRPPKC